MTEVSETDAPCDICFGASVASTSEVRLRRNLQRCPRQDETAAPSRIRKLAETCPTACLNRNRQLRSVETTSARRGEKVNCILFYKEHFDDLALDFTDYHNDSFPRSRRNHLRQAINRPFRNGQPFVSKVWPAGNNLAALSNRCTVSLPSEKMQDE